MNIKIRGINFEDFINYKKPSIFIAFPFCSFKCEKDCGKQISGIAKMQKYGVMLKKRSKSVEPLPVKN